VCRMMDNFVGQLTTAVGGLEVFHNV
jgi:hypothetical protein